MPKRKARTMYMHTFDGQPAVMQRNTLAGTAWLELVEGRNRVRLVPSLRQIRSDWNECADTYATECPGDPRAGVEYIRRRCGYVLVEVPA